MHVPVLAAEATEWLGVQGGGTYVDCTAGAGGHAVLIAKGAGPRGHLLAIDRDTTAVELASERLKPFPWARVIHGNYGDIEALLAEQEMGPVDGVLIDAGMSSMQLDDSSRGFRFQGDGPLDMRMDRSAGMTAAEYLSSISPDNLAECLFELGDVKSSRRVARSICSRRDAGELSTTGDLVNAILQTPGRADTGHLHGAYADLVRQVFQAVRIAVNGELESLANGLRGAIRVLAPGGRLVLLSFQSGEDRVWKSVMRELARNRNELHPDGRVARVEPAVVRVLTKRPVTPSAGEMETNPRSHSARLRAAERIQP